MIYVIEYRFRQRSPSGKRPWASWRTSFDGGLMIWNTRKGARRKAAQLEYSAGSGYQYRVMEYQATGRYDL